MVLDESVDSSRALVRSQYMLEARGLNVTLDGERLVDSIAFRVAVGEWLGIVGESGSGKSLTARAAVGLLPVGLEFHADELKFCGQSVDARGAHQQGLLGKEIGLVVQNPFTALHPLLSVGRQMRAALRAAERGESRKDRDQLAITLLETCGLRDGKELMQRHPHELSGGMAQRAAIAMVLATSPRLLIADEPTTALDLTIQKQVMELIRSLFRDAKKSVVLISHDLGLIATYCDRVLVISEGRLVEEGPTDIVLSNPNHPYTKRLVDNVLRGEVMTAEDELAARRSGQ